MKTTEILQEAIELTSGPRDRTHGEKRGNCHRIALFWNAYLHSRFPKCDVYLEARDVAGMMVCLKLARSTFGAHCHDDFADMCGYSGIMGELADEDADKEHTK